MKFQIHCEKPFLYDCATFVQQNEHFKLHLQARTHNHGARALSPFTLDRKESNRKVAIEMVYLFHSRHLLSRQEDHIDPFGNKLRCGYVDSNTL